MRTPKLKAEALLKSRTTISCAEFTRQGIPRVYLTRFVRNGKLERVGRGIYAVTDSEANEFADIAAVAQKAPYGVIALLSALSYHQLTTEMPFEVWVAIPNKQRIPKLSYPPIRVVRYSQETISEGVELHKLQGVEVKIFSVAKTVADCFKFRNKVGMDVATEALTIAWRENKATMDDLWRYAKLCRVTKQIRPYLEMLD